MSAIEIQQLSYRYPDGTPALESLSFRVAPGERLALVGPNGAGKTTLLWHLNGLLPEKFPAQPAVRVAGLPVCEPHLAEVRRRVGLVFQNPDDQLFCTTVAEDVAFGPRNYGLNDVEVAQRVRQALADVDMVGYESRAPQRLSVGEQKRVCLAGVLACRPEVLCLDEPTANLDPRGRRQLMAMLRRLDCALVIASHDLELVVELADRVLVLNAGRLHADGPPPTVLADEPLMLAHGLETPVSLRARDNSTGPRF